LDPIFGKLAFWVKFEASSNYIIVPLSAFAVDTPESTC
jgi:hypothetical protein